MCKNATSCHQYFQIFHSGPWDFKVSAFGFSGDEINNFANSCQANISKQANLKEFCPTKGSYKLKAEIILQTEVSGVLNIHSSSSTENIANLAFH